MTSTISPKNKHQKTRLQLKNSHFCRQEQECIPVGYVPPAWEPYVFWQPPLDVSSDGKQV